VIKWSFSIDFYDLVFLATISAGLIFSCLLFFVKRINQKANRFLGLALFAIVLWMVWVLGIDVGLGRYFPEWSWLPLQFSLSIGPLIYWYVRKLLDPGQKLKTADWLYFSPLLIEQGILVVEIIESRKTKRATYDTAAFTMLNPAIQALALASMLIYLFCSLRLLRNYHRGLADQLSDAERYQYRWLQRLLAGFGCLWLLWAPFTAIDFVFYDYGLGISSYYPLYLLLAVMIVWIGVEAFLRPEFVVIDLLPGKPAPVTESPSADLLRLTAWLEEQITQNLFYRNAGLTLRGLAEELDIHPNELSRIINAGTGKNFNDFINTYRVRDVMRKIQDPAYDHITLLGIAFDCGFNSKTTFNRTFKQLTGKSPAEYKFALKTAPIL
jgi:putative ABC transport system permease protein